MMMTIMMKQLWIGRSCHRESPWGHLSQWRHRRQCVLCPDLWSSRDWPINDNDLLQLDKQLLAATRDRRINNEDSAAGADFCCWLWVHIGTEGSPPVGSRMSPWYGGQEDQVPGTDLRDVQGAWPRAPTSRGPTKINVVLISPVRWSFMWSTAPMNN